MLRERGVKNDPQVVCLSRRKNGMGEDWERSRFPANQEVRRYATFEGPFLNIQVEMSDRQQIVRGKIG